MISFRYHLVSIVAVFLALALGIVVGTTALSGPITKDLRNQLDDTKEQRNDLAAQVKSLQGQVGDAGQFASTYGSRLVADTLTKQNVLLVVLPSATSGMQSGVARQVTAAGGSVSGVVSVTKNYLDPKLGSGITSLATGPSHPVGLTLTTTSDARTLGGELLSYVLLGKGQTGDASQVLGAFAGLHMLTLDNSTITPAKLVVVVGRGGKSSGAVTTGKSADASYGIGAESALVGALAKGGGHVVVSADRASASEGGLISAIRGNAAQRNDVATVDDADSAFGQVSSILALSEAAKGQVGHYGTQDGADALFPSPPK